MEDTWLIEQFGESWYNRLKHYLHSEEFSKLGAYIAEQRKTKSIVPTNKADTFKAFRATPFDKAKIVILGQDVYSTKRVADGLAFSCSYNDSLPRKGIQPSLVQIFEAVEKNVYKGLYLDKNPNLERWAQQGIFLFNAALTTEEGKPGEHLHLWAGFTKEVLKALSEYNTGIIYCLWGSKAQQYEKYINPKFNYILKAKHPSSANYNNCIWECNHFVEANKILKANNNEEIIW